MEIPIKIKLGEGAVLPFKKNPTDACDDITAIGLTIKSGEVNPDTGIKSGDYIQYHTGIYTEIPVGYEVVIRPRSSNRDKDLMMCNAPGTIDANYRGEWLVCYHINGLPNIKETIDNFGFKYKDDLELLNIIKEKLGIRVYDIKDRIAQCRLQKLDEYIWQEVDKLDNSNNRGGGHGSTGR